MTGYSIEYIPSQQVVILLIMAASEVHEWLRSISNGLDLERLAPLFESRGFRTKHSLTYLEKTDLEVIINSPQRLLLADKRIIEKELENIKKPTLQPKELFPPFQNPPLHVSLNTSASNVSVFNAPTCTATSFSGNKPQSTESAGTETMQSNGYLHRKNMELTENLTLLAAQVASASNQLQIAKDEYDQSCSHANGRKGKLCTNCHQAGHYKGKCQNPTCKDFRVCMASEKHPEAKSEIVELQRLVKELEKKEKKAKEDFDSFKLARERSMNSFFAAMRPRLRRQNEGRYVDRFALDKDLVILKRILNNKVPLTTERDWEFPHQIEQYKRGLYAYNP